ncbi:MAG: hypothetical protein V7745_00515, partial [Pseudomonadales bacterium]
MEFFKIKNYSSILLLMLFSSSSHAVSIYTSTGYDLYSIDGATGAGSNFSDINGIALASNGNTL